MSATKSASQEGVELQSQPKPAAVQVPVAENGSSSNINNNNNLIEVDEPVDVEKAGSAPGGASSVATPLEPKEASVADPVDRKKHFGLFSRSNSREKRDALVKAVMVAMIVALGATVIGLGVKVGKDRHTIQDLQSSVDHPVVAPTQHLAAVARGIETRGTYLEGMSGVLGGGFNVKLAKHAVDTASIASAAYDDTIEDSPTTTAMVNLITTISTIRLNSAASPMVYLAAANSSTQTSSAMDPTSAPALSIAAVTPLLASPVMTTEASLSTSHTCAEWGDGAGPCTRPYGQPNSIPASVLSAEAALNGGMQTVTYASVGRAASVSSPVPIVTVLAGPMAGTTTDDCGATATVTVTVTAGAAAASTSTAASAGLTVYGTSTQVSFVTLTIGGLGGGPLTTTETVVWHNSSSSSSSAAAAAAATSQVVTVINGTLTTLSRASFTITMPAAATMTTTTTTGPAVVPSPTGGDGALASGGERSVPRPLAASSSGGSGVYCAVMLTTLLALLL